TNNIQNISRKVKSKKVSEKAVQNGEQARQFNKADIHTEKVKDFLDQVRIDKETDMISLNKLKELKATPIENDELKNTLKKSNIRRV
ncbi:hypothetical protein, partial [Ruminiclostridium cellobioparum]|uniref:hypothetical protein n=1 Tax=Ruminiclostridium cellobioparum TaxID=29355 RepID=UPI0028AD7520